MGSLVDVQKVVLGGRRGVLWCDFPNCLCPKIGVSSSISLSVSKNDERTYKFWGLLWIMMEILIYIALFQAWCTLFLLFLMMGMHLCCHFEAMCSTFMGIIKYGLRERLATLTFSFVVKMCKKLYIITMGSRTSFMNDNKQTLVGILPSKRTESGINIITLLVVTHKKTTSCVGFFT